MLRNQCEMRIEGLGSRQLSPNSMSFRCLVFFLPPKRCKTLVASFEKLQVLNDLEGEQRQLRDLKAIVDAHKLQAGLMLSLQIVKIISVSKSIPCHNTKYLMQAGRSATGWLICLRSIHRGLGGFSHECSFCNCIVQRLVP